MGMNKRGFSASNVSGKKGEELVASYMRSLGWDVEYAPDKLFPFWDLKATKGDKTHTFEVKYDMKAYMYAKLRSRPTEPNLYIEFKNTNKGSDSGIKVSEAETYVYILLNKNKYTGYFFNRAKLLEHLEASRYKVVGNSNTGDDNAEGWIPPLHKLVAHRGMSGFLKEVDLTDYVE